MKLHRYTLRQFRIARSVGLLTVLVAVSIAGGLGFLPVVVAAEGQPGITVSPARLQLTLPKGQQSQAASVMLKNSYSQRLNFAATIRGVQQSSDGSLVPDVGQGESPFKDILGVSPATFDLDAGQSINLTIQLTGSDQLAPGGQYAALLVTQVPEKSGNVRLTPAVAAGLFIVKEEGAVRQLTASISRANGSLLKSSNQVDVLFRNEGNVPLTPRAVVRLTDPTGQVVAQGISNEESLTVMPGKDVKVRTVLQPVGSSWHPGKYRLSVQYRYEGSDQTSELAQRQLVVPPKLLAVATGGVVSCAALVWAIVVCARLITRRRRRKQRSQAVIASNAVPHNAVRPNRPKPRTTDGIVKRSASDPQRVDKQG